MHKGKFIYATIYLTVLFALTGCGGRLGITARSDGKADLSVVMDTGKAASAMISSIMASLDPSGPTAGPTAVASDSAGVFTPERAQALEKSLAGGDAETLSAKALSSSVLSLDATVRDAASQTSASRTGVRFASVVSVEKHSLTLNLSPATMRALYASMDLQTRSYVDLFMAPVFTGEPMSGGEYTALIASVYGKDLAQEIADARMEITLSAPRGEKAASCSNAGAKLSGRSARFSIPLLDLLVLEEPQSYRITW
ncbi:MAG: hypothetical protein II932_09750 [Treponema sp.]|nr:hypothetical protein [Treponema sp.]